MSVFIQIIEAMLDDKTLPAKIAMRVKSKDTQLTIEPITAETLTVINHSLIASIKQKKLTFVFIPINQQGDVIYTTTEDLSFSPFHFKAEKQFYQSIWFGTSFKVSISVFYTKKKNFLGPIEFYDYQNNQPSAIQAPSDVQRPSILEGSRAAKQDPVIEQQPWTVMGPKTPTLNSGNQQINVNEREKVSDLREVKPETNVSRKKFPELGGGSVLSERQLKMEERKEITVLKQQTTAKKSRGLFFCCGNEMDQKKFQVQSLQERQISKPEEANQKNQQQQQQKRSPHKVQFYKGPCRSKNIFSLLDAGVNDNKYTVMQSHYKNDPGSKQSH